MDSYPPYLLRLPDSKPGSPARGRQQERQDGGQPAALADPTGGRQESPPLLLAVPGQPGSYEPSVSPEDRPDTIGEMDARVRPPTPEPWPAGTWVPMGFRGRRGHWNGERWRSNPSPGYGAEAAAVRSEPEQTTEHADVS